jgi:hypothetical protein
MKKNKDISSEELASVLNEHKNWLDGMGTRADLSYRNFSNMTLNSHNNLSNA